MIDLSDGIAADAPRIAQASRADLHLELGALPLDVGVAEAAALDGSSPHALAASGGDDYELLFCIAPAGRAAAESAAGATGVTWIGEVAAGKGALVFRDAPVPPAGGYEHAL
jgi:thiamine-monophosphate kinase